MMIKERGKGKNYAIFFPLELNEVEELEALKKETSCKSRKKVFKNGGKKKLDKEKIVGYASFNQMK